MPIELSFEEAGVLTNVISIVDTTQKGGETREERRRDGQTRLFHGRGCAPRTGTERRPVARRLPVNPNTLRTTETYQPCFFQDQRNLATVDRRPRLGTLTLLRHQRGRRTRGDPSPLAQRARASVRKFDKRRTAAAAQSRSKGTGRGDWR